MTDVQGNQCSMNYDRPGTETDANGTQLNYCRIKPCNEYYYSDSNPDFCPANCRYVERNYTRKDSNGNDQQETSRFCFEKDQVDPVIHTLKIIVLMFLHQKVGDKEDVTGILKMSIVMNHTTAALQGSDRDCSELTTEGSCVMRSDCNWDGEKCNSGPATSRSSQCLAFDSSAECPTDRWEWNARFRM